MSSFNRILATTDLSAPARHATERAALVSKNTEASLDLLHVAIFSPLEQLQLLIEAEPDAMEAQVLDTVREQLLELATGLRQRYDVSADKHVVAEPSVSAYAALAAGFDSAAHIELSKVSGASRQAGAA